MSSIAAMVAELIKSGDNDRAREAAEQTIHERPVSVEVRTAAWHTPEKGADKPDEFLILLSWGCPAYCIVGTLDKYGVPSDPVLQYQDWGTQWTDYTTTTAAENAALQTFCEQFNFGE